jgi:parallel beta-helix repeat protein
VEGCLLERNGFRSKGKGVLVFDGSSAVLRGNTIRQNRDGVTVSRRSNVRLLDNLISANFDKGLGVSAASLAGSGNSITLNGLDDPAMSALSRDAGGTGRPPNRDGLRVGLGSRVELANTIISGNADAGVVVNDDSLLRLSGGRVTDNGSRGVVLHERASVELRGVEIRGHGALDFLVAEGATLTRLKSAE